MAGGGGEGSGWVLVEALLQGGAPWGFTLQGGLEHGEPLIISKVEEGGKADSLEQPLHVGDELVIINDVELSGFRQEAIALVKGSYKTLKITIRREFDPGYIEEFVCPSALPPPSSSSPQHTAAPGSSRSRPCSAVQLRIKSRRSEPASRPHSWHSAKLSECQQEMEHRAMDTMSGAWPQSYHASASTTDLSGGFDSGEGYLRKSPDQYSSRGSMESLDPAQSSQFHSGAQRQHPLELHGHSAAHPAYSSCQQLSSARSSSSIDHLHSKRDSAYSSFSTSSSIPEYLASTPSFSPERCYSLETVPQRGGSAEMLQTEARCVRSGYDGQQGLCKEHELGSGSASTLGSGSSRAGLKSGLGREVGVCYRGNSSSTSGNNSGGIPASNRHSVGPIWGPTVGHSSYESLKGAPAPPRRSDSFAAIRNHERPNSWSSLENARSLRSLQKGSWHHSSGPVAPVSAKGSYGVEGQLHTVIEKSPESSPTTKPRQGGGFLQPPSPTRPSASPPAPSARTVLPTSVLPAAQMPGPGLCGVYSGSTRIDQSSGGPDERPTETWTDERMSTTENGRAPVAFPHPAPSAQLRTQPPEASRPQHLDSNSGSSRPNRNSSGPEPQSLNGLQVLDSWGPHSQSFTEGQKPDVSISQVLSDADHKSIFTVEKKNHHVPGYSWGDQNRPVEQSSTQPEPVSSPRLAQGQVPKQPQPLAPPPSSSSSSQPPSRHFSDSAAPPYQHWDHRELDRESEHPLTRLEIALAEVQRCASSDGPFPGSNHDNSITSDDTQGPARSLSVLEKVNRFERRECGGRQRSLSTNVCLNRAAQLRTSEKGRISPCGADDIRSMLERSTKGTKAHRTMSYRGGSSDYMRSRTPADPMSALQRSRSSFQLDDSMETETNRDFPWRQDIQETKDTSSNRSSRDVLKDAHAAVLWNTSMKQRNLSSSLHPSAAPPSVSSPVNQPASVPAKYPSLEKRGPKTMPKPLGVVITPQLPSLLTSPHTPKERHVVNPDVRGPSPPALPRVPPVGPPALLRICGRRRLTADQKKRSFSEPENMNEVGVLDSESAGLFRRGGDSWLPETSVADRRKMFELAGRPGASTSFQSAPSRSDLRQVQQDALAEYVERKRGARRGAEGPRSGPRPHSVYLQPDYSSHTDTISLSSASSLLSLQDPGPDPNFLSGERGFCSSLPPGADLRGFQSNFFYPGRVTSPRPPAQLPTSASSDWTLDLSSEGDVGGPSHCQSRDLNPGRHRQTAEPQSGLEHSRQLNGALERAGPSRRPGKSASAEDLLERLENKPGTPQHHRSRSSPTAETLTQSFPQEGVRMFGVSFSESGRCPLAADRPADTPSRQTARSFENLLQPVAPSQDASHTPVTCRERPKNTERPRAQSTSMLAASVGLPCPFSPAGVQDTGGPEWRAGERLSRANLEAISFPDIPQSSRSGSGSEALEPERQTRHSLSDAVVLEETTRDAYRSRAFSLDTRGTHPAQDPKRALPHPQIFTDRNPSRSTASPPPCSPQRHPSSLRISESSLCSPVSQQPLDTSSGSLKADLDEVFLQNPPPPPPPPSPPPFQDISVSEDFPPPPPLLEFKQEVEHPSQESTSPQSSPVSLLPSSKPPPPFIPEEEELSFRYEPVPRREQTREELRAQALARQLVLQEPSLAPLLEPWRGKCTVELMEEIFPNIPLTEEPHRQSRRTSCVDDRTNERLCSEVTEKDPDRETDLDEEERDPNTLKVELCEALRNSIVALQQEKESLCEEQRGHKALGASIEELLQQRLKANEKDKYSMFIGDLERIVNLLLSLCSRLSRIDRSLLALERDELMMEDVVRERESLHHKRSLLLRQTEDARELKENLDRRQRVVHAILSGYLTEAQLQDYRRFVSTKPSLLIRLRRLDELVRLREQQLAHLDESADLPPAHAWSTDRLLPSPAVGSSLAPPPTFAGPAHSLRSTAVTSL
ncbi:hypothetical protein OJAV_G00116670 [Oryzias javanicus]|uniref:PDZ domain-containing protein n=1 Tax=Oryzias javanicus TaxID=123683 RepID=A0A3S2ME90_ORYJA|nr:hypothetical protein OJAV_G00116670 [Oryzias javanicus]